MAGIADRRWIRSGVGGSLARAADGPPVEETWTVIWLALVPAAAALVFFLATCGVLARPDAPRSGPLAWVADDTGRRRCSRDVARRD